MEIFLKNTRVEPGYLPSDRFDIVCFLLLIVRISVCKTTSWSMPFHMPQDNVSRETFFLSGHFS